MRMPSRELRLAILAILATPLAAPTATFADPTSGSDSAGPVSTSTVTIGGDSFAIDPRGGSLNYSFSFFKGNVNYGQTPFELTLQLQQTANGTYVGGYTDSDDHAHPFGVSAYLPTAAPQTNLPGASELDDSGAVWDLNLPSIMISTSQVSKYYGDSLINATVTLGDASYQFLMKLPSATQDNFAQAYTSQFLNQATPLYSKDASAPVAGAPPLITFSAGSDDQTIVAQDKYGTRYVFGFSVLYGYKGVNVYDPDYNSSNNAKADQLLVYRIQKILYANGQSLSFYYQDQSYTNPQNHQMLVRDTMGNLIANVSWAGSLGSVQVANQQGQLAQLYQLNATGDDYRIASIQNSINFRTINYAYKTLQAVPYAWNNQTTLASITNSWTGQSTVIGYDTVNTNKTYDAGCNNFSLGQAFVSSVTNTDGSGNLLSTAGYDYGFGNTDSPNFAVPLASGKRTYGSGMNHWLDNLFYGQNQDSDGCSKSDMVVAANQTYSTDISTGFPITAYNRQETMTYDALGRATLDTIGSQAGGGASLTWVTYGYAADVSSLVAGGSFDSLPFSYGSPTQTSSGLQQCTLNGVPLNGANNIVTCMMFPTENKAYDDWGNPTQVTSALGQLTEYTYLLAGETNPPNERLAQTVKTHSIGNDGASWVLETQTFKNIAVAPAGSGALETATLPLSNVEHRYDAATGSSYDYRSDTMGNYIAGDTTHPALNGIIGQRGQADLTGVSDVASLNTGYSASIDSYNGQSALSITSTATGTAKAGAGASVSRGGSLVNFMGYPLQHTNPLGQKMIPSYDDLGRLVSKTTMAGTAFAQTTRTAYDLSADLGLNAAARFSVRDTDEFGNLTVRLLDFRQRHIATYRQLVNQPMVQTAAFAYDAVNNQTSATIYGSGYQKTENYYYGPGSSLRVATVPNYGLAQGRIVDGFNGNTLEFSYSPASTSPTAIGRIYGPVKITHADNLAHLVLADALIDADAASDALTGFDLVRSPANAGLGALTGNPWASSGYVPQPLATLYQAIGNLPGPANTPGANSKLQSYNTYGYDEWNRQVTRQNSTFVNAGSAVSAQPELSVTTTTRAFNTGQLQVSTTLPQGQTVMSTFNLLNGLQESTLLAGGKTTALGGIVHDGLGREIEMDDSLNGGKRTAGYDPATGLLVSGADAYGNTLALTYDPVSFLVTQSTLTPAGGGSPITVERSYDEHLRSTQVNDNQGNTYGNAYAASGLPASRSVNLAAYPNPTTPFQYTYGFDSYADLTHVSDPFLPYADVSSGCQMAQSNTSSQGYDITRDGFGRISQISAKSYHGLNKTYVYDPVTGQLASNVLAGLPQTFGCGDTGSLSITTTHAYDDNLRPIAKTVTQGSASSGSSDLLLKVSTPAKSRTNRDIKYMLRVKNQSPRSGEHTAFGVRLTLEHDRKSDEIAFGKLPPGCRAIGANLSCELPNLPAKRSHQMVVTARTSRPGGLTGVVKASAMTTDPKPGNNSKTAHTNICDPGQQCRAGAGVTAGPPLAVGNGTAAFAQTYDPSGRVASSSRTDFYGQSLQESYAYDLVTHALTGYGNNGQAGNLSAAPYDYLPSTGMVTQAAYSHDLYGNITQAQTTGPAGSLSRSYAYSNATNPFQLSAILESRCQGNNCGAFSGAYSYDIAGNTVQDGYGRSYGYDAHGLLASVTLPSQARESYVRDGLGRTVQRQLPALPGIPGGTVVDFGGARAKVNAVTGIWNWQVDHLGGTASYAPTDYSSSGYYIQETGAFEGISDLASRPVGNLGYGTGFSGAISNTAQLPYGAVTNLMNTGAGFPAGLQQTTQFPDAAMGSAAGASVATGLEIKGDYRAYDPVTGRFLQWDSMSPFGMGGINGYAYAANDPINFWDPTGHYAKQKSHRYGPKPKEAHHHSDSFWGGLIHGLKHGAKSIYMGPYHWGKSLYEHAASGNMGGFLRWATKSEFNQDGRLLMDAAAAGAGGFVGMMVLNEFVTTNASNIFSGKDPFSAHVPFKGNAYEVGYQLGDQSAVLAEAAVITAITLGAGAAIDAAMASVELTELTADAGVMDDAEGENLLSMNDEEFATRYNDDNLVMPRQPESEAPEPEQSTAKQGKVEVAKKTKLIRKKDWDFLTKELKNRNPNLDISKDTDEVNEVLNSKTDSDFESVNIKFSNDGTKWDWAKSFKSPKMGLSDNAKAVSILSHGPDLVHEDITNNDWQDSFKSE